MKNLIQFNSIQAKIVVWSGVLLLGAFAAIIAFSVLAQRNASVALTEFQVKSAAQQKGYAVQQQLETPLLAARSLAHTLQAAQASDQPLTRAQVKTLLYEALLQNPELMGAWTLWEPNAFDNQDSQNINSPAGVGGQTGRLLIVWSRNDRAELKLEFFQEDESQDFYQCPKQTKKECVVDPYLYEVQGTRSIMTSTSVPIMINGRFVGVVGMDIDLQNLGGWADQYKDFNNRATIRLITATGRMAAVKNDWKTVEQSIQEDQVALDENLTEALPRAQRGMETVLNLHDRLAVYVPLTLGKTDANWAVNIDVPRNVVYETANMLMWQQIGTGIALALVGLGVLWLLSLQLVRPVRQLTTVAEAVSAGRLDLQADVRSRDEVGVLARAFNEMILRISQMLETEREQRAYQERTVQQYVQYLNEVAQGKMTRRLELHENGHGADDPLLLLGHNLNAMTENLQSMIIQIRDAAQNLSTASTEILASTTQQAAGASEQSAAIAQTSTTVDEVRSIAEMTSQRTREVTDTAQRTVDVSRAGQQAVQATISSMTEIKERVEGIAENILALSEQTQQIGEIIATVSDIAAQSNMLALNASVEAARAGEHGKGFSVVAVEVRNLAEQSRLATVQVKAILSDIQKATNATVMATEEGNKGVDKGVQLAYQAQESIERLTRVINETAQSATQVEAGSQQQVMGVQQLATAMLSINQATMQSLASTRQAEQSAQNLSQLARHLAELVTRYQA